MKKLKPIKIPDGAVTLYFSPTLGKIMVEETNEEIDSGQARSLWSCGLVENCNIAFQRLATEFEFDITACLDWYDKEDKQHRYN